MKNKIIVASLLLCLSNLGYSQNLSLGLKIGGNVSKLEHYEIKNLNSFIDYVAVNNFNYGLFINYCIKNNFSFQSEINYKSKGFEYNTKQDLVGLGASGKANVDYIEIPLLVKYCYGNKFKGFINTGTSINLLIGGGEYNYHRYHDAIPASYDYSRNLKSDFNKMTIGIVGSIGLSYCISQNIDLLAEFRYSYDLSNSADNHAYVDSNTQDAWYYNNSRFIDKSVNFGIAYKFGKNN